MTEKYVWVTVAIIAMWLVVAVAALAGGELRVLDASNTTEVPVVWGVAGCAALATAIVAFFGYRNSN